MGSERSKFIHNKTGESLKLILIAQRKRKGISIFLKDKI